MACGETFPVAKAWQKYCSHRCRSQGSRTRHDSVPKFIGIDGEGFGTGADHRYQLIGCGTQQIQDPSGLDWETILEFLYSRFLEEPTAVYVGFFLGYDFTNWLRSLPAERAARLLSTEGIASRQRRKSGGNPVPFPVELKGKRKWYIDFLGFKRAKFRPAGSSQWMYVCDSGAFFQTSFLNVIDPKDWADPVCTQAEYDTIEEGKAARGEELDNSTAVYNQLENEILGRVMTRLAEGLRTAGVHLNRSKWFGPGQAAQEWMRNNDVPSHEEVYAAVGKKIWRAAMATYFGGWFEIMAHGHVPGTTWEYDINSAYPYIMSNLPCLLHGEWKEHDGATDCPPGGLCMVYARVEGSDPYIGAMLHRNRYGRILRPHATEGWFWLHELDAARKAGIVDTVSVTRSITYSPCDCPKPLAGLSDLYAERLRVGKNTAHGKALKLIYNSVYGKFAQSIGHPMFGNPIYASLITAGCRTMILEAIGSHPHGTSAVVMVATDGVYFRSAHPSLARGKGLGQWEEGRKENLTLFKPGVYWDDKSRRAIADGDVARFKARGVNSKDFSKCLGDIDVAFDALRSGNLYDATSWPAVEFPLSFSMVTPKQALQRGDWAQCGYVSHDATAHQRAHPTEKRAMNFWVDDGMIRSSPKTTVGDVIDGVLVEGKSYPYQKGFGEPCEIASILEDLSEGLTRDGIAGSELVQALR